MGVPRRMQLTIAAPSVVTHAANISIKSGTSSTLSFTVKTEKGTSCAGTLSLAQPSGPAISGPVIAGSGTLSVTPAAPASLSESLAFSPTCGFCTSLSTLELHRDPAVHGVLLRKYWRPFPEFYTSCRQLGDCSRGPLLVCAKSPYHSASIFLRSARFRVLVD